MRTDDFRHQASGRPDHDGVTIEWLATPGHVFSHPRDVLDHPDLEVSEKRAILASWASDVRVVESEPSLRQIDCGAFVPLSEILSALSSLGDDPAETPSHFIRSADASPMMPSPLNSKGSWRSRFRRAGKWRSR